MANFSMLYRINPQWEVMADAQWTGWSSIPELRFNASSPPALAAVPLNWDDTWKIAAGASYKVSDQWKARFGVAFDQTPVTNDPTVRLPDSDRWWLTRRQRVQVDAELEVRRRLRLHLRGQPELQPEPGQHGGERAGQRHVRRERVDPVDADDVHVLAPARRQPARSLGGGKRPGNPGRFFVAAPGECAGSRGPRF